MWGEGRRHINKEKTTKLNWIFLCVAPLSLLFSLVSGGERGGWRDTSIFWFVFMLGFSLCIKSAFVVMDGILSIIS